MWLIWSSCFAIIPRNICSNLHVKTCKTFRAEPWIKSTHQEVHIFLPNHIHSQGHLQTSVYHCFSIVCGPGYKRAEGRNWPTHHTPMALGMATFARDTYYILAERHLTIQLLKPNVHPACEILCLVPYDFSSAMCAVIVKGLSVFPL